MSIKVKHLNTSPVPDWTGTVTVGNSSGGTNTRAATDLIRPIDWNSDHAITYQPAASDIASWFNVDNYIAKTTNTSGITLNEPIDYYYEPLHGASSVGTGAFTPAQGSWYLDPVLFPNALSGGRFNQLYTGTVVNYASASVHTTDTGTVQVSATLYNRMGLFSRHSNGTHMVSVWSNANDIVITHELIMNTTGTVTSGTMNISFRFGLTIGETGTVTTGLQSTGSGSLGTRSSPCATTRFASLASFANIQNAAGSGSVFVPFNFDSSFPSGQYFIGFMHSSTQQMSTTGGGYTNITLLPMPNQVVFQQVNFDQYKGLGKTTSASNIHAIPGLGAYSAVASIAPPATIAYTDIVNAVNTSSQPRFYWLYRNP